MKTLALFITIFTITLLGHAQEKEGITITVTVPNATTSEGKIAFGLYDENTFMKAAPLQAEESTIKDGIAKITFKNVPQGTYAISCYHDANSNNQMDFEPNGMPKENYGVSNNPMSYGPPIWGDAKFEVENEDIDMTIRL